MAVVRCCEEDKASWKGRDVARRSQRKSSIASKEECEREDDVDTTEASWYRQQNVRHRLAIREKQKHSKAHRAHPKVEAKQPEKGSPSTNGPTAFNLKVEWDHVAVRRSKENRAQPMRRSKDSQ